MGATGGRENMSSHVHRLIKFVPFIMHLNDFSNVMLFSFWLSMSDIVFHKKGF